MAILFADDFNGYGTDSSLLLNGLYAQVFGSLVTDPDPSATGVVFNGAVQALSGSLLRRVFPSNYTTAGFAFRLWMARLPTFANETPGFMFSDAGNNVQFYVAITTTGAMNVRLGSNFATVLGTTTGPVITANAYNHIEVKAVASATVGTLELRVNGVPVLSLTNINTGTQYSQFRVDNPVGSGTVLNFYIKDLICWNSSGTYNNNFLGTVSVVSMVPNSDVTLGGWTPSTGTTGFNLLDNSPPLDGSQYLTALNPPPAFMRYGMTDLPTNVTSVRALISQVRVRKSDGGDGNIQASLLSAAATANGADRPVTTAFTYYEDVFETDPNTSAPWTPAAASAATLKINRTL